MIEGIRSVTDDDGTVWYAVADVARLIGVQRANNLAKVCPEVVDHRMVPTRGGFQRLLVVQEDGLKSMLRRSRKPRAIELCKELGLYETRNYIKETDTLFHVMEALSHLDPEPQKPSGPYRVDLHFPTLRVAVECDEHGHRYIDSEKELSRQRFIEDDLDCTFVRFDPDDPGFNIFKLINQILTQGQ